jgi:phthiocerol/phenolphthiocerol synthesis type-I polyketide synthase E
MTSPVDKREGAASRDKSMRGGERWSDGIAIVGMSARFPRSRNFMEYWGRLLAGELLISEYSKEELNAAGVDEATLANANYVCRGVSIDEADCMDAPFFGLSRREAEILDPQQRVLLETSWEALENAGYTGDGERVGVFAGVGPNTHMLQLLANPQVLASVGGYQAMLGNEKDYLATRVAYKLNLRGPAVTVQTACSTSLATVHLACRSILAGECEMAIAGGVSIVFPQGVGYLYMPGMILSPDGYCRPFDAAAGGTVPGGGAGVVVLKRLSRAIADEDFIYAAIRGTAWNNDGSGKAGYTVPSVDGQAAVIRGALDAAGITADRIGYVEAHGTATELGDPIEFAALTEVFAEHRAKPRACVIGAVKSNMGHADTAAGVAGLIKAALAVQTGIIPPTLNFHQPNPYLEYEGGPFVVSNSTMSWSQPGERWAGVSSFGIGGTNVHAILSSVPDRPAHDRPVHEEEARDCVFPVSAFTPAALTAACDRLARHMVSNPTLGAEDVAATLQLGRREFPYRRAAVASDCRELAALLQTPSKELSAKPLQLRDDVVFLFPGQGQQFAGMAKELYRTDPVFKKTIDKGESILREETGLDLLPFIAGGNEDPKFKDRLQETDIAQPVLFLVEYALAARWQSLGIKPAALLGHSLGELSAAAVAGVFSFEDGLRLAATRGRLMAQTPPGIMLAISLPPEKLAGYFEQDVWVAAENGPKMSVASGLVEVIELLERRLQSDRIAFVRLASKNAFHTPLMANAAKAFQHAVESVARQAPAIPWLSNVSGGWVEPQQAQSGQYWGSQIVSRVRFTQSLATLAERPRFLLEVGPGEALIGLARQQMRESKTAPSLGAENRRKSDRTVFLEAAARLWESGVDLDWKALQPGARMRRVPLPTYPFERQRYWIQAPVPAQTDRAPKTAIPISSPAPKPSPVAKRSDLSSWFYAPYWQSTPPASVLSRQEGTAVDSWLVLLDRDGFGEALVSLLRQQGAAIIAVLAADRFSSSDGAFTINPEAPADYERLWQAIAALDLRPAGLLNLWTMRGMNVPSYNSLVLMLQSAGRHRQRFRQLEIVTDRLESVLDEEIEDVQRAEVLGLSRVLSSEYAGLQCRSIDVDLDVDLSGGAMDRIVRSIVDEFAGPGGGQTLAYRRGIRWRKEWSPAPLRETSRTPFRKGGVYLITGGVGGIGYSVAEHLLREHQARVVLTGRTPLPVRSEWADWMTAHDGDDPITRRILRMQQLERAGGEVSFVSADVCDLEAMSKAFASAREQFGRIDGVVHAAGVPGGGMAASQDLKEAENIRRPKVQGSMVLAELLQGTNPDFFLMCSSISAVAPPPTQGAYAAANDFQNYFARYCRDTLKLPAVAIDFDAWQEVGMAAEMVLPEGFESVKEDRLRTAMSVAEGLEVIRRVLTCWEGPQILTATVPLEQFKQAERPPQPVALEVRAGAVSEASRAEQKSSAELESNAELAAVVQIWQELLAAGDIAPSDNFFELGGHSLMGTMVLARIRDRFGVALTLRTLFDSPTAQGLAEALRSAREASQAPAPVSIAAGEEREEFEF